MTFTVLVNAFIRKTEVKISKNTFCENEFNGLLINGRYNNCIVQGNGKITGNMKSGICVNGLAFPIINLVVFPKRKKSKNYFPLLVNSVRLDKIKFIAIYIKVF